MQDQRFLFLTRLVYSKDLKTQKYNSALTIISNSKKKIIFSVHLVECGFRVVHTHIEAFIRCQTGFLSAEILPIFPVLPTYKDEFLPYASRRRAVIVIVASGSMGHSSR